MKAIIMLMWAVGLCLVISLPVMLLWNWLIPPIFGIGEITFWQASGLQILNRLLFKTTIKIKELQ